jgi:hypothetical protein
MKFFPIRKGLYLFAMLLFLSLTFVFVFFPLSNEAPLSVLLGGSITSFLLSVAFALPLGRKYAAAITENNELLFYSFGRLFRVPISDIKGISYHGEADQNEKDSGLLYSRPCTIMSGTISIFWDTPNGIRKQGDTSRTEAIRLVLEILKIRPDIPVRASLRPFSYSGRVEHKYSYFNFLHLLDPAKPEFHNSDWDKPEAWQAELDRQAKIIRQRRR